MKPDLFWIDAPSGRLAIVARPRGGEWLAEEIPSLAREVDVVVSLLTREEESELGLLDERDLATAAGISFLSSPVSDRGVPADAASFAALAKLLALHLAAGKRVAMHCRMGLGRSAMLAAAIRVMQGVTSEDAFRRVRSARGFDVPDTQAQREFVERLAP